MLKAFEDMVRKDLVGPNPYPMIPGVIIEHQFGNVESIQRHGTQGFNGPQPIPNVPDDPWSHN